MNWNKSPLAYADIRDTFERALATPHGIRISFNSHSQAVRERARFNYYRKLHRKENLETYPLGHPMHGQSVYDTLTLVIPPKEAPDANFLYLRYKSINDFNIEEL